MEADNVDKARKKRPQKKQSGRFLHILTHLFQSQGTSSATLSKRKALEANIVDEAGPARKRPRKNQSGEFYKLPQDLASSHPSTLVSEGTASGGR